MESFKGISLVGSARPIRSDAERAPVEEIKARFRTGLGLDAEAVVTINEVDCRDPRCPSFETIIVMFVEGQFARSFKIVQSIIEISEASVIRAIAKENSNLPTS